MNSELKQRWLEALRSGHYTQGTSGLRYDDTFDALGVLCDVIDPTKWEQRSHYYVWVDDKITSTIRLPMWVNDTYGLEVIQETEIAELNDSGVSFAELADWIESEIPDELFTYVKSLQELRGVTYKTLYQGHWVSDDNDDEWRGI